MLTWPATIIRLNKMIYLPSYENEIERLFSSRTFDLDEKIFVTFA